MPEGLTLGQIGEQDLIKRLAAYARPDQWNDDAALLPEISPERWVISSDTLVEGVHFSADTTPASAAGWRAAAANLSDLAAMGCRRCEGITVALSAPGDTEVHWIEQAYGGMQELLQATAAICWGVIAAVGTTGAGHHSPGARSSRSADPARSRQARGLADQQRRAWPQRPGLATVAWTSRLGGLPPQ